MNNSPTLYDARFRAPCSIFIAGATGAGKTHFIFEILKNFKEMFTNKSNDLSETESYLKHVLYYYKAWQPIFEENKSLVTEWLTGIPSLSELREKTLMYKEDGGSIVIIDDSFGSLKDDISTMFTVYSHHHNCIPIFTCQNLFPDHKMYRNISLNSKYIVIFKNPRDSRQIANFARQFSPGDFKYIVEAFETVFRKPHSYVLFDLDQKTPDVIRVRSNILPKELPIRVWAKPSML